VEGFDPAIIHVECSNDSDIVPGALISFPLPSEGSNAGNISAKQVQVISGDIPPYKRAKSKEQTQPTEPPCSTAWKETHDKL
jgi:hypothetical protein